MRVTNSMLAANYLNDMNRNLQNMQTLQQQLSSGKEISKPSDDPFKTARIMQINTNISANAQYNQNIKDASSWLDATDTSLNQVGNVLQRVKELLVSAGNTTYGSEERKSIKDEINQQVGQLSQILNTNFDGKYVFGGTRGTSKPTNIDADSNGNNEIFYCDRDGNKITNPTDPQITMIKSDLTTEVSQGVSIDYNVSAGDVLEFTNESGKSVDVMSLLNGILTHLDDKKTAAEAADPTDTTSPLDKLTGSDSQGILDALNHVLTLRSEVGAKQNRMDSAQQKNEDESTNLTALLSSTQDIDFTEKVMKYTTAQTVYTAALQTSARVIQPTLMDYLR
ncbi:flagellar hook-associated protein FlgL [Clostridium sp. 19966]|uniref:flagellar hook-associated protein FlgL n=1 Tax=Clostridium sp. 19966 TaxID=2768166 RepID=UPI0028DEDA4A|nr:flagellar hook-associated protein FlgL [Clostridium sp. 19966]MDT8716672.1 flagellar hook-associated protein FlgL [Clostridium sp. 19966]